MREEGIEAGVEELVDKGLKLLAGSLIEGHRGPQVFGFHVFFPGSSWRLEVLAAVHLPLAGRGIEQGVLARDGCQLPTILLDPDHSAEAAVTGRRVLAVRSLHGGLFVHGSGELVGLDLVYRLLAHKQLARVDSLDEVEDDLHDDHVLGPEVLAHVGSHRQESEQDILVGKGVYEG